jgi:catechol 2,3-dioxygenase-like lactoylglutathione lyase family enzyme
MKIEHMAFNVANALAMSRWYVENLGFRVVRGSTEPPFAHFLADESGTMMLELYSNPSVPILDYDEQQPMSLHLAFVSHDVPVDVARLLEAGASIVGEVQISPQGDHLAMLRDPWGFSIQFVKRAEPMF